MKLQLYSDLHLEFKEDDDEYKKFIETLPRLGDVVILAGDITTRRRMKKHLGELAWHFQDRPVLYVPGNHDFYGGSIPGGKKEIRKVESCHGNFHFLDAERPFTYEGQRFIGHTLWFRWAPAMMLPFAVKTWPDFSAIHEPQSIFVEADRARVWLEEHMEEGDVVISHHLPCPEGTHPKWKGQVSNMYFIHNLGALIDQKKPAVWCFGHCFDDETEVLTRNGWKKRPEIESSDEVVTLSLDSGHFEWNGIEKIWDYPKEKYPDLCSLRNQNIDLLVTPDHGLVEQITSGYRLLKAKETPEIRFRKMICSGDLDEEELPLSEEEIRLIVWVSADAEMDQSGGVRWRLKKQRKIERLTSLLSQLKLNFSAGERKDGAFWARFNLRDALPQVAKYFDFSTPDRSLPHALLFCSSDQKRTIIEEYCHTVGGKSPGRECWQISTGKEKEADLLQAIAVTSGFRCNKIRRGNVFALSGCPRQTSSFDRERYKETPNPGSDVWCLTVKNGTLLVRRRGKVCITQNTHNSIFEKRGETRLYCNPRGYEGRRFREVNPEWNREGLLIEV